MKSRFAILHVADMIVPKYDHFTLSQEEREKEAKNPSYHIPVYAVLFQHPTLGNILFDTGIDVNWKNRYPELMKNLYTITTYDLREKLNEVGLHVDDIDILILSHMHMDHAGNLRMFQGTKAGQNVYVAEEEFKYAFMATNVHDAGINAYYEDGYYRADFNGLEGIEYKLIKEDTKLADDFSLILLPGHTNAVMGVVFKAEETGTVIFPSDAIYNSTNYGPPVELPGLSSVPEKFADSVEKCRKIAEQENGKVFFSHDYECFKTYKKSPEWYE